MLVVSREENRLVPLRMSKNDGKVSCGCLDDGKNVAVIAVVGVVKGRCCDAFYFSSPSSSDSPDNVGNTIMSWQMSRAQWEDQHLLYRGRRVVDSGGTFEWRHGDVYPSASDSVC